MADDAIMGPDIVMEQREGVSLPYISSARCCPIMFCYGFDA